MPPSDVPPILPTGEADARAKAYRLHAFLRPKYPDLSLNTCLQAMAVINGQPSWQDMLWRIKAAAAVLRGVPSPVAFPPDADPRSPPVGRPWGRAPQDPRMREAAHACDAALGALRDGRNVWLSLPSGMGKSTRFALPASLLFQGHVVYVGEPGSIHGPDGAHLDIVPYAGRPAGLDHGPGHPGPPGGPPLRCGPLLPAALNIFPGLDSGDHFAATARKLLLAALAEPSKDGSRPAIADLLPAAVARTNPSFSSIPDKELSFVLGVADAHLFVLKGLVASGVLSDTAPRPDASTRQAILDPDSRTVCYLLDLVLADVLDRQPGASPVPLLVIVDGRPDVAHGSRLLGEFARGSRRHGGAVAWCSQSGHQAPPAAAEFIPFELA